MQIINNRPIIQLSFSYQSISYNCRYTVWYFGTVDVLYRILPRIPELAILGVCSATTLLSKHVAEGTGSTLGRFTTGGKG